MKILVIADMYGTSPQLLQFASELAGDVSIITAGENSTSKINNKAHRSEANEQQHYANKVASKIRNLSPHLLIGFGVGSSAAWQALSMLQEANKPQQLIAFYPSHTLDVPVSQLACPVTFYFAQHEFDFDVTPIVTMLNSQKSVSCIRTRYQHGFMEPLSGHYDPCAYRHYLGLCQQEVADMSSLLDEACCNYAI